MTLVHVTVWHVCEEGALWHLTGCPATHLLDKWLKRSAGMFVLPVSAGAFSYYHAYSQYTQHYPGVCETRLKDLKNAGQKHNTESGSAKYLIHKKPKGDRRGLTVADLCDDASV